MAVNSPRQRRLHDGVEFPELDSIALAAAGGVRRGRCLRGARGEQRDGGGGAVRGGEQFDLLPPPRADESDELERRLGDGRLGQLRRGASWLPRSRRMRPRTRVPAYGDGAAGVAEAGGSFGVGSGSSAGSSAGGRRRRAAERARGDVGGDVARAIALRNQRFSSASAALRVASVRMSSRRLRRRQRTARRRQRTAPGWSIGRVSARQRRWRRRRQRRWRRGGRRILHGERGVCVFHCLTRSGFSQKPSAGRSPHVTVKLESPRPPRVHNRNPFTWPRPPRVHPRWR